MQLATIDVDRDEAKSKLAEYRRGLDDERTEEDKAIAQAAGHHRSSRRR